MNQEEKEWFLNLPEEIKLDVLENSLKEDKFGVFMEMTKILLEAPIQNGGVSTEKIETIRKKYF
jgi:hypothetical protein